MAADHSVVAYVEDKRPSELTLDREIPVELFGQARYFAILPPRHVLPILEGRRNEGGHRIRRETVLQQEGRREPVGRVREAGGLCEALLVCRAGGRRHLREGAREACPN